MAHSSQQLPTATHLPPQLANVLGDAASTVAELCFMAPGVPWSARLLDDLLTDFRHGNAMTATCDSAGACICAVIAQRSLRVTRKQPGGNMLVAYLHAKRSNDQRPLMYSRVYYAPDQSFDRAGLRKQIEWCQRTANDILRRGFCDHCYDSEPPAKRLRVSGTQCCGRCLFERCLHPSSSGSGE